MILVIALARTIPSSLTQRRGKQQQIKAEIRPMDPIISHSKEERQPPARLGLAATRYRGLAQPSKIDEASFLHGDTNLTRTIIKSVSDWPRPGPCVALSDAQAVPKLHCIVYVYSGFGGDPAGYCGTQSTAQHSTAASKLMFQWSIHIHAAAPQA